MQLKILKGQDYANGRSLLSIQNIIGQDRKNWKTKNGDEIQRHEQQTTAQKKKKNSCSKASQWEMRTRNTTDQKITQVTM